MPYQDGTGPMGTGAKGNRLGPCSNKGIDHHAGYYYGRGRGRRHGRFGRFRGPRYPYSYNPIIEIENNPEKEKELISKELTYIEKHKETLKKRLQDLESAT